MIHELLRIQMGPASSAEEWWGLGHREKASPSSRILDKKGFLE
jgi:hypothetical protein